MPKTTLSTTIAPKAVARLQSAAGCPDRARDTCRVLRTRLRLPASKRNSRGAASAICPTVLRRAGGTKRIRLPKKAQQNRAITMIPTAVMGLLAIFGGVRTSPFSGTFTPVHFLPHALGALLFVACTALAHGSDY